MYHTPISLVPNVHCTVLYPVPFHSLGLIFHACIWSQAVHTSEIVHQTRGMLVPTLHSYPKNFIPQWYIHCVIDSENVNMSRKWQKKQIKGIPWNNRQKINNLLSHALIYLSNTHAPYASKLYLCCLQQGNSFGLDFEKVCILLTDSLNNHWVLFTAITKLIQFV